MEFSLTPRRRPPPWPARRPRSPTISRPILPRAACQGSANPAAVKTPSDYVRALRRRIWLVFMIGVPLSIASAGYAVHQKAVYRAGSQIVIKPPQYDPMLETMIQQQRGGGRREADLSDKYLPNRVAQLKSKGLAERVVNDPAFLQAGAIPDGDAADELIENLQTKILVGTNYVNVYLEGQDPARTARQLSTLLDLFYKQTKAEIDNQNDDIRQYVNLSLTKLRGEIQDVDKRLIDMLRNNTSIGPGGKNLLVSQYESLGSMLSHKKMRLDEVQQQALMAQLFPKNAITSPEENSRQAQIDKLHEKRQKLDSQLRRHQRLIRNFASDPAVKDTAGKLEDVLDQLDALQRIPKQAALDPADMILNNMREEIHAAEEASKMVLGELRESMPKHQMFLALQEERVQKAKRIGDMETKLSEFNLLLADAARLPSRLPGPGGLSRRFRSGLAAAVGEYRDGDRFELRGWVCAAGLPARAPGSFREGSRAPDDRPDAAAPGRRPSDQSNVADAPGGAPVGAGGGRVRSRRTCLPQPPRPACSGASDRPRPDRDPAGHERPRPARARARPRLRPRRDLCPRPASGRYSWTSISATPPASTDVSSAGARAQGVPWALVDVLRGEAPLAARRSFAPTSRTLTS